MEQDGNQVFAFLNVPREIFWNAEAIERQKGSLRANGTTGTAVCLAVTSAARSSKDVYPWCTKSKTEGVDNSSTLVR